jgi:TetR/AcrR family transcriptional regulator, transcriptional repressor for nem operon
MARTIKEEEYAIRRNEILDVTQRLIYTRGYEQITIQDILDELKISKGAFYHYFNSKLALLETVVECMMDEALNVINPIISDPALPALEKLQRYFSEAGRWKTDRKDFVLALMETWYTEDNIVVRHKVYDAALRRITPLLGQVICQGVAEGVFNLAYPDEAGQMILSLMIGYGDIFAQLIMKCAPTEDSLHRLMEKVYSLNDAIERILGAPPGSLNLVDEDTMREWVVVRKVQERSV